MESLNGSKIILLREGVFWRAYEHSAFLFVRQIRSFAAVKRSLKVLNGGQIVSIGFPLAQLPSLLDGYNKVFLSDSMIEVESPLSLDSAAFASWKDSLALFEPKSSKAAGCSPASFAVADSSSCSVSASAMADSNAGGSLHRSGRAELGLCDSSLRAIDAIRCFDVASKTPLECMSFICELKNMVRL